MFRPLSRQWSMLSMTALSHPLRRVQSTDSGCRFAAPRSPPQSGDDRPDRLDNSKRPRTLKKPVRRTQATRGCKPKDQPVAAPLQCIANEHRRHGKQSERTQRAQGVRHFKRRSFCGRSCGRSPHGPADAATVEARAVASYSYYASAETGGGAGSAGAATRAGFCHDGRSFRW